MTFGSSFWKKRVSVSTYFDVFSNRILQWLQKYVIAKAGETRGSRTALYDKCKHVQVDLGRIKKVESFEKNKLLFSNFILKISWIIVIDLHFFCSVNRSRNQIHVHQAWSAIFYCIHLGYWWPVLEFEFRIGAIGVNSWFWINLC